MKRIILTLIIAILLAIYGTARALDVQAPSQTTPEASQQEIVNQTVKDTPKPETAVKEAVELDPVKDNPNGCDLETQYVWSDFTCHDKPVAQAPVENVERVASSASTPQVSDDCYYDLLSQYDWDVATMQRIMRAESGCNPNNHNYGDNHGVCLGSYGLLQIGCVHGQTMEYLSDPANNIATAYIIWLRQGYTAWSTY